MWWGNRDAVGWSSLFYDVPRPGTPFPTAPSQRHAQSSSPPPFRHLSPTHFLLPFPSFDQLAGLCDPSGGKGPKSDRVSVVVDAIRVIQQLRVENNQLKQLNKFLEERVRAHEQLRAQAMMRRAMAQQQQHAQQGMAGLPADFGEIEPEEAAAGVSMPVLAAGMQNMHMAFVQVPAGQLAFQPYTIKQERMPGQAAGAGTGAGAATGWLPAPDISQDQKLRPPAA
jgi:hypothetical protein